MPDRRLARISLLLVVSLAPAFLGGCATRPALIEPGPTEPLAGTTPGAVTEPAPTEPSTGGEPTGEGLEAEGFAEAPLAAEDLDAENRRLAALDENSLRRILQPIYFAFDSSALSETALRTLERNAAWLRQHPDWKVRIEGHCDERGTSEYNLALGARRARRVRDQLVQLGISPDRIETISYGEERPVDPGHDEAAWSKNRRAEFVPIRPEGQ